MKHSRELYVCLVLATTLASIVALATPTHADVYYIGAFAGSSVLDDLGCGTGRGAHPDPHPCAHLWYWNETRGNPAGSGDVVRLAPGTYTGRSGDRYNCIVYKSGVVYEGRTNTDQPLNSPECGGRGGTPSRCAYGDVTIDLANSETSSFGWNAGQCVRSGTYPHSWSDAVTNVAIRDLEIRGGPRAGARVFAGGGSKDIILERLWIHHNAGQGILVERPDGSSYDCAPTDGGVPVRRISDLVIIDNKVHDNAGVFGGIAVGCVDGFEISRNEVFRNYGSTCTASDCLGPRVCGACDDHDGIQVGGAVRGIIADNHVYENGEDDIDVGGHFRESYYITIERNTAHGSDRWGKMTAGVHHLLWRHNVFYSDPSLPPGGILGMSQCAHDLTFDNNTLVQQNGALALRGFSANAGLAVRNNIFYGTIETIEPIVSVSRYNTTSSQTWKGNLLYNAAGPNVAVLQEFDYASGRCDQADHSDSCRDTTCPSYPSAESVVAFTGEQLSAFRAEGDAGRWFGPEGGDTDVWNCAPRFADPSNPSWSGLQLATDDTCARNAGVVISDTGTCTAGRCTSGLYGYVCVNDSDCNYTTVAGDIGARDEHDWIPRLISAEPVP